MFRDASGPLYEFLKSIGRPMDDCGNKTPLRLFVRRARRSRPTTLDRGAPERIDRERFRVAGKIELKISRRALSAKSQLFWSQPIRVRSLALARI